MKPNFIWVGQGKAGSSLTFRVLSRHPDIFMGAQKEHNVFSRPVNRQAALDHYAAAAKDRIDEQMFGDISPSYYDRPVRINRIANFYKDEPLPKILMCLRHPISFAVSRYHQVLKIGKFLDAAAPYPGDINRFVADKLLGDATVVDKLRHVVETLGGPDNICLLVFEDDFAGTYDFELRIYRALGLSADTRYYDKDRDGRANKGLRPWFALPKTNGLPSDRAAFCSVPARSRTFDSPDTTLLQRMEKANEDWQEPLSATTIERIEETLTQPLQAYVQSTFGRTLTSWDAPPPVPPYQFADLPSAVAAHT